jgi:transposase
MNISVLGIALAKNVLQLHGVDDQGKVVVRKQLTRPKLLPFVAQLSPCRVGMEAWQGAHYWAREMRKLGHDVRLISPQFVTPYRQSHKNDPNDAAAICEAGRSSHPCPSMCHVCLTPVVVPAGCGAHSGPTILAVRYTGCGGNR